MKVHCDELVLKLYFNNQQGDFLEEKWLKGNQGEIEGGDLQNGQRGYALERRNERGSEKNRRGSKVGV